jgi:cell division protein FtsB
MIKVSELIELQTQTVEQWHQQPVDNPYSGIHNTVCQQHSFNYLLWHEEDIARSRDVTDEEIARVKRSIDSYNQQRNDWIEKVDDEVTSMVESSGIDVPDDAPMNTETPGCTIDRLSILALRIYHLKEQLERTDATQDHRESVEHKIAVCLLQQNDLKTSLSQLLEDIFSGRKRHRTYRQFKMYNDPTLNPYLYKSKSTGAKTAPAAQ